MVLSAAKWTRSESPCVAGSCEGSFNTEFPLMQSQQGIVASPEQSLPLGRGFSVPPQQPEADFCTAGPLDGFIVGF